MGFAKIGRCRIAVLGICRGFGERDRARGPGQTASRLLRGADDALRAKERRADGGDYRA